ncbi:hypothetical protein PR048_024107 [Dryococelus australis]|uniref:Uncharacterized protein n=1 Tax=Dryococelus australis TaxID=614101 RepID=A0ABQ9GW07_9NEOP|nr:hypothetical protein PR048_024107 [Dryococelus australis]
MNFISISSPALNASGATVFCDPISDRLHRCHCPNPAAVAERLARSPPAKASRVQSPAGSPDFCTWESCRTMPLGFSRGSPVSPAPSLRRRSVSTSITFLGSQDLAREQEMPKYGTLRSTEHNRTPFINISPNTQDSILKIQDPKHKTPNSKLLTQDSRLKTQDSKFKTLDTILLNQDSWLKTLESRLKILDSIPILKTQNTRPKTQDRRLKTPDTRDKTLDSRLNNQDP